MDERALLMLIPLGLFVASAILGWRMAGRGQARGAGWIGGACLVLLASLILHAQGSDDPWSGIATAFLSVAGLGPVVLGLWLGALAGWWKARRR